MAAQKSHKGIIFFSLAAFVLIFFIIFHETQEVFSSFTAALLGALMILGTLIVINWLGRVFSK